MSEENEQLPDITHGLDSLTETTTPAELMKRRGQRTKLRTINKAKLRQWIEQAIGQSRAGMVNQYDDREKEELLRKTQQQLEDLMARAARAEAAVREREERDASLQEEIEQLRAAQSDESASTADLQRAMATIDHLTSQREEAQNDADDLRADLYQLQDQLNEKLSLLQSTIDEKDKLNNTMKDLMGHATDLVGGVLGLDNDYYGGRHQNDNQLDEDADPNAFFYHDYAVGAQVIESLSGDLQRLREITARQQEEERSGSHPLLLDEDLALLEQLKAGRTSAIDAVEPIASLCEALEGTRAQAIAAADAAGSVMGIDIGSQTVSAVPDPDEGNPEEVLAGCTAVVRELAASFVAAQGRLAAMKALADDADQARGGSENEQEELVASNRRLVTAIVREAERAGLSLPALLQESDLPVDQQAAACEAVIEQFATAQSKAVEQQAIATLARQLEQALEAPASEDTYLDADADADAEATDESAGVEAPAADGGLEALQRQVNRLVQDLAAARAGLAAARSREASLLGAVQSLAHQHQEQGGEREDFRYATATLDAVLDETQPADSDEAAEAAQAVVRILAEQPVASEAPAADTVSPAVLEAALAAARQDASLADDEHVQALGEVAASGEVPEPAAVLQVMSRVGERLAEVVRERDEMAESGREVIAQLSEQRATRDAELETARSRLQALDSINREYIEAVGEMAEIAESMVGDNEDSPLIAAARELNEALAAMPGDEEVGIDDQAAQAMVASSKRLVSAFKVEMDQVVQDLQAGSKEIIEVLNQRNEKLSGENERLDQELTDSQSARIAAESAARDLAESLAALAESQDSDSEIGEACADLEALLSDEVAEAAPVVEVVVAAKRVVELLGEGGVGQAAKERIAALEGAVAAAHTQAEEALGAVQTEREAMEQDLQETLQELDSLKRDSEQAQERTRELEDRLADDQHQLQVVRDELGVVTQNRTHLEEEVADQNTSIQNLRQENAAALAERDHLLAKVEKLIAQQESEIEQAQAATSERLGDLEMQLGTEQATAAALREELEAVQKTASADAETCAALRETAARQDETLATLTAERDAARRAVAEERAAVADLRDQQTAVTAERDRLQEEWEEARSEWQSAADASAQELTTLKAEQERRSQEQAQQLDTMLAEQRALEDQIATAHGQLAEREQELEALRQQGESRLEAVQSALAATEAERDTERQAKEDGLQQLDQVREAREELEAAVVEAREACERTEGALAQAQAERDTLYEELTGLREQQETAATVLAAAEGERDRSKTLLREARAALDEYRAREAEMGSGEAQVLAEVKERLTRVQSERDQLFEQHETEMEDQRIENAALRQRLQELQQSVVSRDEQILDLKEHLDQVGDMRITNQEFQARVSALAEELERAQARTRDLERQVADLAGGTGRAGGLQEELTLLQSEREQLLARVRSLEDDLAVEKGKVSGLSEAREKQRQNFEEERLHLQAEVELASEAKETVEGQLRRLKGELAGLQARVRTLTSDDSES